MSRSTTALRMAVGDFLCGRILFRVA